jgi:hypothetical protein
MKLTELYKSKTIAEKQQIIDLIKAELPHTRETAIRSWLNGNRNPKPFAKKIISNIIGFAESELFDLK